MRFCRVSAVLISAHDDGVKTTITSGGVEISNNPAALKRSVIGSNAEQRSNPSVSLALACHFYLLRTFDFRPNQSGRFSSHQLYWEPV